LYWQFYQQWTDEYWCVAPACCRHSVVLGIVCESRDIAEKFHLFIILAASLHIIHRSTPFVQPLTDMSDYSDTLHCLVWHMSLRVWSQICHVGIWVIISWTVTLVCVCVCVCTF
jgi:hypothetical protein